MTRSHLFCLAAVSVTSANMALADARAGDGQEGLCEIRKVTPNWIPGVPGEAGDTLGLLASSHDGRYVVYGTFSTVGLPDADQIHGGGQIYQVVLRDTLTQEGELISVAHNPQPGETIASNHSCEWYVDISPNGRYVAFASRGTNLVEQDVSNEFFQTYVRDRHEQKTYLVSRSPDGEPANDWGTDVRLGVSNTGRVAFASRATNLHPEQPNNIWAVYMHDIHTGETELISRDVNGNPAANNAWGPAISADGNVVAFVSPALLVPGLPYQSLDVYVRDLNTNTTEIVSVDANGNNRPFADGFFPRLSHNGDRVAFKYFTPTESLDPSYPPGWFEVIYVRTRSTNRTTGINVTLDGQGAHTHPEGGFTISGDGQHVAWETIDQITKDPINHMWHVYRTDVDTLESVIATVDRHCQPIPDGHDQMYSAISGDGNHIVFNSMFNVLGEDEFDWQRHLYLWVDPNAPEPRPVGDLNGDGVVDVSDLLILLGAWGSCSGQCPADLNGDGVVDVSDLLMLLSNWG